MARVLVVDDEEALLRVFKRTIKRQTGYDPDTASDLDTAKRLVSENVYELVLSDNDLPGSGEGLELLLHVSQVSPSTSRVLISGYGVNIKNHPYVQEFHQKPITPDTLREVIARYA